jgi:hypothetical protein
MAAAVAAQRRVRLKMQRVMGEPRLKIVAAYRIRRFMKDLKD